jgi:recombinational DNA repair protein (RecF pathway)
MIQLRKCASCGRDLSPEHFNKKQSRCKDCFRKAYQGSIFTIPMTKEGRDYSLLCQRKFISHLEAGFGANIRRTNANIY